MTKEAMRILATKKLALVEMKKLSEAIATHWELPRQSEIRDLNHSLFVIIDLFSGSDWETLSEFLKTTPFSY